METAAGQARLSREDRKRVRELERELARKDKALAETPRGFATIEEARIWVQTFVTWYNTEHRHSAIRFVTPDQRHRGEEKVLLAERHRVYQMARAAHPERWSGQTRNWQPIGSVWLNPERPDAGCRGHGAADALPH